MRAAFIGLGAMGYPMAGHLVRRAGVEVTVFNRTASKADAWCAEFGGRSAGTPALAASEADVVVLCVGDDPDVRAVLYGAGGTQASIDGVLAALRPGTLLIDTPRRRRILHANWPPQRQRAVLRSWMRRCQAGRPVRRTAR